MCSYTLNRSKKISLLSYKRDEGFQTSRIPNSTLKNFSVVLQSESSGFSKTVLDIILDGIGFIKNSLSFSLDTWEVFAKKIKSIWEQMWKVF